ncbi:MAG: hypothetical protein K6G26_10435 [Lachnospiraceae bacterium]|nr:hypothetical protein [Lachnospiraceae bacterium]
MKKRVLLALILIMCLAGCSKKNTKEEAKTKAPKVTKEAEVIKETKEPEPEESKESHYKFNPYAISQYEKDIFGEKMVNTWFNIVDALMKGEEMFECPDQFTYDWVMGQMRGICLPVAGAYTDVTYGAYEVTDGYGKINYLIPVDEYLKKQEEFIELTESILNEYLDDDDSDFEKCLKLYLYMVHNYEYDYDVYNRMEYEFVEETNSYRPFIEHKGICHELSSAYSYLLVQAGVNATTMSGDSEQLEPHQWSYVEINGKNYHIDPTFGLGENNYLYVFMMNDEQRGNVSGYYKKDYIISCVYAQEYGAPEYSSDDDSFSFLWDKYYIGHNEKKKTIRYSDSPEGSAGTKTGYFSYKELE